MVSLRDLVRGRPAAPRQLLPLVHTTKSKRFLRILRQNPNQLEGKVCSPLAGALVYLFYGRPAYRVEQAPSELKGNQLCPSCFFLKADVLGTPRNIFVFDTGGYSYYKAQAADLLPIQEFALHESIEEAVKFVIMFYGNEKNYLLGKLTPKISHTAAVRNCKAAMQYLKLRDVVRATDVDDRAFATEFSFDGNVSISNISLEAVVVPAPLLAAPVGRQSLDDYLKNILGLSASQILKYRTYPSLYLSPKEYHLRILDLSLEFFQSKWRAAA